MLGPNSSKQKTLEFLKTLIKDINANQGTVNCGHCALRLDLHIREGQNLRLGPVPSTTAQLFAYPQFKNQTLFRSYIKDKRLIERCLPNQEFTFREICNLEDENPQFEIDLTQENSAESTLKLHRATRENIVDLLRIQPKRLKDNTAFGFMILTQEHKNRIGHIINYFVDSDNEVYFLDAQRKTEAEQISQSLPMLNIRPEIFYIPSLPPEGYKPVIVKKEGSEVWPKRPHSPESLSIYTGDSMLTPQIASNTKTPTEDLFANIQPADLDEKLQLVRKIVDTKPNNAYAWNELGRCFLADKGDKFLRIAILSFEKAIELKPDSTTAQVNLLLAKGRNAPNLKEAWLFFEKAIKISSSTKLTAVIWVHIGLAILKNPHDANQAFHCFLYANSLDDSNTISWDNLAKCYDKGHGCRKDNAKAKLCFDNVERVKNNQPITPLNPDWYTDEYGVQKTIVDGRVPLPNIQAFLNQFMQPAAVLLPAPAAAPFTRSYLPSSSVPTSAPATVSSRPNKRASTPDEKSEVDLLIKENELKKKRIELMQQEIDLKDRQLAELRKQLAKFEAESKDSFRPGL